MKSLYEPMLAQTQVIISRLEAAIRLANDLMRAGMEPVDLEELRVRLARLREQERQLLRVSQQCDGGFIPSQARIRYRRQSD